MIGSKQAYFLAITIPFLTSSMVVYSLLYKAVFLSQILNVPASYVEATMSYSFYGGAVGGLALGYIADKFGNRLAMLVSAAIYSAASIAAPFVRSLLILSFLWVIVGFGVNAENGITYAIVVKLFETSRGTFGGFLQGLYFIGMSIDTLLALFLKDVYSYFFIIGLAGAFSAVLFLILPESKSDKRRPSESLKKYYKSFALGSLISFSAFFYTIILVTFVPLFVKGYLVTFYSLTGFTGFIIFGYLSDAFDRSLVSVFLQAAGIVFVIAALTKIVELGYVFFGLYLASSFFSYLGIWVGEFFPEKARATGINASLFVGRLMGGAGPLLVAYLGRNNLFSFYTGSLLTALILGLFSSLLIKKYIKA
ncbi:MAG: MFS transporter [Nitrososphaeria archaeon]|jgi:MFS family permease